MTLFAGYWQGFVDHWMQVFTRQDSIVMLALGVGAIGIFIITRGKWLK